MGQNGAVQADFDRIALLGESRFDHNGHYHELLLGSLGNGRIGEALDLGCGTGAFTRLLAARADRVLGVDLSANMIAAARERSAGMGNAEFLQADATAWDWPVDRFDCVVSIATLHHLPMEEMVVKIKAALRPGGRLLVLDLWRCGNFVEWLAMNSVAMPASLLLRVFHEGRLLRDAEVRRVWGAHARTDRYLTVDEVRKICREMLPGAVVRRHLLWRYSLVWKKEERAGLGARPTD